jgi:hypothetical protein
VSKQNSPFFSINSNDESRSQQQRLLSHVEDDDDGPDAPYVRAAVPIAIAVGFKARTNSSSLRAVLSHQRIARQATI